MVKTEIAEKGLMEIQSKYDMLKKQLDEEEKAIIVSSQVTGNTRNSSGIKAPSVFTE